MNEKQQTPPNSGPVTPHLVVAGGTSAIDFYQRAFGAQKLFAQMAEDGDRVLHACLDINGGQVFLCDSFPEMPGAPQPPASDSATSPVGIHLSVADVDAAFEQAKAAGAEVTMPLADMFWGERYGKLRDPFGHHWSMSAPLAQTP